MTISPQSTSGEFVGPDKLIKAPRPAGFPGSLKICGQTWQVGYIRHLADLRGLLGETRPSERLILVDIDQSQESMVDTLWHESLHALIATSGARLSDEEALISVVAPALTHFLRSNKAWW